MEKMKRNWMKTSATYTLAKDGHADAKHTFNNLVQNVSEDQIKQFGVILAELSGAKFKKATLSSTDTLDAE